MTVTVNGERRDVPDHVTVTGLIEALGLQVSATVVERNGEILERTRYTDVTLAQGDVLELVRFVGGG